MSGGRNSTAARIRTAPSGAVRPSRALRSRFSLYKRSRSAALASSSATCARRRTASEAKNALRKAKTGASARKKTLSSAGRASADKASRSRTSRTTIPHRAKELFFLGAKLFMRSFKFVLMFHQHVAVIFHIFQNYASTSRHCRKRIVRDDYRHLNPPRKQSVQPVELGAAADKHDTAAHYVGKYFRRRGLEHFAHGLHKSIYRLRYCLAHV